MADLRALGLGSVGVTGSGGTVFILPEDEQGLDNTKKVALQEVLAGHRRRAFDVRLLVH
ncbi:MAG: hypothetical protein KDD42_10435 [Bdellovibrionales bacterium]|nr:hypothetical protein [Bdellovibrionales bacterium]